MFNDFADLHKDKMIKDVISLVNIPSFYADPTEKFPYGKNVNTALDFAAELAKKMGFFARNTGYCTEILYGGRGEKSPEKVYIAGHLDVVPAGDGWSRDPWKASVKNGRIYGRGTLDDKGPSIAVLYALKALKSLGIEPKARIHLVLGGDEERGMEDLKRYVRENGLPDFGLTPDSSFPIVYAEAGVIFADFLFPSPEESGPIRLIELSGGRAYNCVADLCRATLQIEKTHQKVVKAILDRSAEEYSMFENLVYLQTVGVSAHGSMPSEGQNAIFSMLRVLSEIFSETESKNSYLSFAKRYLTDDLSGKKLGIFSSDTIIGDTTLNLGMAEYGKNSGKFSVDIRLPVQTDLDGVCKTLKTVAEENGSTFRPEKIDQSTYMPKDHFKLVRLAEIYEKITKKPAEFLSCRGATYAKVFESRGVAFGPIDKSDPNQGGGLHGADEFISIDALLSITKIYAEAIYRLFC